MKKPRHIRVTQSSEAYVKLHAKRDPYRMPFVSFRLDTSQIACAPCVKLEFEPPKFCWEYLHFAVDPFVFLRIETGFHIEFLKVALSLNTL